MSRYSAPLVGRAQGARGAQRVQLRPPQGFVGIDVADAGDERLVDEERLEARAAAPDAPAGTRAGVKRGSSGSGPTPSNGSSSAPYSPTRPNLRMSRKRSSRAVVERQRQPLVRVPRQRRRHHEQLAGHLEVDRQEGAAGEVDDQLLAAPPDRLDPATRDARREPCRVLVPQRPLPAHARARDRRAGPAVGRQEAAPEVARDGLDLGKLRHRRDDRAGSARAPRELGHHRRPMIPSVTAARARSARIAVSTLFFASGVLVALVPAAAAGDPGRARPDQRRARGRDRRAADRGPARRRVRRRADRRFGSGRSAPWRASRQGARGRGDRAGAIVAGARALVPGARRVRRGHGRVAERARRRRAARVRPVDPAGAPRDVGVGRARRLRWAPSPRPPAIPVAAYLARGGDRSWRSASSASADASCRARSPTRPSRRARRGPADPAAATPLAAADPRARSRCSGSCASSCRARPRPGAPSTSTDDLGEPAGVAAAAFVGYMARWSPAG